ncbi:hypothetical protein Poli38472_010347 [Pythium oligandrum]|uniref:Glucanase n=1 Tax=Pythium oligandrum TaxID=41045 RepID=A0A8K1C2V9_PYTOL|nr:hypothetical protein Poli38472_010347 [Pythium oligandrum]|eukprot:TMW55465.1 hypothetical protein Poli38472_010347 [Pythium oligandrum]
MWRTRSLMMAAAVALVASLKGVVAEELCSVAPGTYAQAKINYPEAAFAIAELEKHGIATWYTDREGAGDYVATAKQIVAQCPSSSRLSIVVYGLPDKDCEAGESRIGTRNKNSGMYQEFVSQLQQAVGDRKVLYVVEPDAVGLLASGGCATQLGYKENVATAISTLSKNPNADIYLDVGHWMLSSPSDLSNVASIVRSLMTAGRIKGISINTSNYRSNSELSSLCGNFRNAMSGTDLKCIIDTSRNYNGPSSQNEWCNYKGAGIGKVPTSDTGDANIAYYVWIKPPGESDGSCAGRSSDAMVSTSAGGFFLDYFKAVWNAGSLVKDLGMPKIDGTIRDVPSTTTPASSATPSPSNSSNSSSPAPSASPENGVVGSSTGSKAVGSTGSSFMDMSTKSVGVVTAPIDDPIFKNSVAPITSSGSSDGKINEVTTKSSESTSMGSGVIVLLVMIAVAAVALTVVVVIRKRQRSLEETKSPLEPRIHYLSNSPRDISRL